MRKIGLFLLMIICFNSCSEFDYKYADKPSVFECSEYEMDLISEAVYTFEDYLMKSHVFREPIILQQAYANYWGIATSHMIPRVDTFDPHVLTVFNELKQIDELWIELDDNIHLNPNSQLMRCLQENIADPEFNSTLKALLDSNTYRQSIIAPVLRRKTAEISQDKALGTLVALDMFYAKLFAIDFSRDPQEIMQEQRDQHAGHNH